MSQIVEYNTRNKLSCSSCIPSTVILCVDSSLVAPHACGGDESAEDQPFAYGYIEATLTKTCKFGDGCTGTIWRYTFQYETTEVLSGVTLTADNIEGVFCKGCMATWMEQLAGDDIYTVLNDDGSISLFSQHGCEFILPVYTSCEQILECINIDQTLSGDGSVGDPFGLAISTQAANALVYNVDGMYVPAALDGPDWNIIGNNNIVAGTHFLGTTNDVPVQIRVNNVQVQKYAYDATSPMLIGGYGSNAVSTSGDTIAGGGKSAAVNSITTGAGFNFIGGGDSNLVAASTYSLVTGGKANQVNDSDYAGVLSGRSNVIAATCDYSAILSGQGNGINGGTGGASTYSLAAGYDQEITSADYSAILSGSSNNLRNDSGGTTYVTHDGVIAGGNTNTLATNAPGGAANASSNLYSGIFAGFGHQLYGNSYSGILSGRVNLIQNTSPGLATDRASGNVILGGEKNYITDGECSSILGGGALILGRYSVGYQSISAKTRPTLTQTDLTAFTNIAYFGDVDIMVGNTNNAARAVKFYSPQTSMIYSGAKYSSFEAQAQVANIRYILPATLPTAGQHLAASVVAGSTVTLAWV